MTENQKDVVKQKIRGAKLATLKAKGLNEDLIDQYLEAFTLYDRNSDGLITDTDVLQLLNGLGERRMSKEDITKLMKLINKDGNGELDFEAFVDLMIEIREKTSKVDDDIKNAFKVMDVNGHGFITESELKDFMTKLGQPLSDEDVKDMMKIADADGDGKLGLEDFSKLLKNMDMVLREPHHKPPEANK